MSDYYDSGFRVTRGGVPCRVFQKRDREQSARIAAIAIARDAGVELELEDAPAFAFIPAATDAIYRSKGARPVPSAPRGSTYYMGAKRYVIAGVPCRTYRDKLNHSFSHWTGADPIGDWTDRAQAFADALERSRETGEAWTIPSDHRVKGCDDLAPYSPDNFPASTKPVERAEPIALPPPPISSIAPVAPISGHSIDIPDDALGGDLGAMLIAA